MKRIVLYVVSVCLIVGGAFLLLHLYNTFRPQQTGALQVNSNIPSDVYLDGELVGNSPFCSGDVTVCSGAGGDDVLGAQSNSGDRRIVAGQHTIKIVPKESSLSPYVVDVDVYPGVMTAVERTFLPDGLSSTYMLTLEKKDGDAGLFVQSIPSDAIVSVDGVSAGVTPYRDDDISASEHVLEIQKDGFAKKTIRVRAVDGYLLVVNVILGASDGNEEEFIPEESEASESAEIDDEENETEGTVTILDTPTGFLRVRSGPGIANEEILQVNPGDSYPLLSENNGWYEILLDDETVGWITQDYAERTEN